MVADPNDLERQAQQKEDQAKQAINDANSLRSKAEESRKILLAEAEKKKQAAELALREAEKQKQRNGGGGLF